MIATALCPVKGWSAFQFNAKTALGLYAAGGAPTEKELISTNWLQIGGISLGEDLKTKKTLWPQGSSEKGLHREYQNQSGMKLESKIIKIFQRSTAGLESMENFTEVSASIPWVSLGYAVELSETAATLVLVKEKEISNLAVLPKEEFVERCKLIRPNQLICARFWIDDLNASPSQPSYLSLYQKESKVMKVVNNTIQPKATPANRITDKSYKCAMVWRSKPVQLEFLSFVVFDKKEMLGSMPFWGVGGAWIKGSEGAVGKVLILGVDDQDSRVVYRIAKLANSRDFGRDFDAPEKIKNERGLPMVGSVTIPKGGGNSEVTYPPGWSETAKAYTRTLRVAPNQAHCVESDEPPPVDVYRANLGVNQ